MVTTLHIYYTVRSKNKENINIFAQKNLFYPDNAPAHSLIIGVAEMYELNFKLLPNSPELVPSIHDLSITLKIDLVNKYLDNEGTSGAL